MCYCIFTSYLYRKGLLLTGDKVTTYGNDITHK